MVTGNASVVANADSDDVANMASLEVPVQVRVSDNILQAQGQLQQKPKAVKTSNDEKVHQVLQLMIPMTEQFAHGRAGTRALAHRGKGARVWNVNNGTAQQGSPSLGFGLE